MYMLEPRYKTTTVDSHFCCDRHFSHCATNTQNTCWPDFFPSGLLFLFHGIYFLFNSCICVSYCFSTNISWFVATVAGIELWHFQSFWEILPLWDNFCLLFMCLQYNKWSFCFFQGQFIQTHKIDDTWYGLQMESIECVAREGLACVIHMELEVWNKSYCPEGNIRFFNVKEW